MSENNFEIEKLKDSLKLALNDVAVPLEEIDFTKENYNKLFPRSRVKTPIENVKLGANQFEKLEKKERQKILQAVHDTLATPDVIINEEKEDVFGDKENSHLYAKSYIIDDKIHGIQSVVVSIDGENVSISTHERDINNIVNKIKKPDQLLYAAAKVRLLVEQHTVIPQSVVNPNRDSEYVASPSQNISQNQTLSTSAIKAETGTKRKIYLSGKITGDEGFAEKFKAKEDELTARGDLVFNPALHPDMFTHGQFMQIDLLALSFCDSIYLMDNWRDSKGAKMEFEQAKVLGLDVEFENEPYLIRKLGEDKSLYYSEKSKIFIPVEDVGADDFYENIKDANRAALFAGYTSTENVEIIPASEVFGKQKEISFEQAIKNEKNSFSSGLSLFSDLTDVLENGEIITKNNPALDGEIRVKRGGMNEGLVHLIDHRIRERVLNKKENKDISQSKKETAAILFLAIDNIEKKTAVKEPNGHFAVYNRGIKTIIGKDKNGRYVVTGYDNKQTKKEAAESINAVIAEYGSTPEFLGIYAQVGAVIASYNILHQENAEINVENELMSDDKRFSSESALASYLKDIQTAISGTDYSDSYVLNLSKNILFNRGATLHLESSKDDYTKSEIKEIKDGLKALKINNPKKLIDVLKNTDPESAKKITKDYEKKIANKQQERER